MKGHAMNVKTVLARLNSTLDLDDRMDKLLLLPRLTHPNTAIDMPPANSLVVGYDGSPNSQSALDLAFCVAHQMQLAAQQQVMIHVVYVTNLSAGKALRSHQLPGYTQTSAYQLDALPKSVTICDRSTNKLDDRNLEEIDRVLWQARCLAEEWRGSFASHLRFGGVAQELETFVREERAALLFLGCHSANHSLVQALKDTLPCSVIGIPSNHLL
jgi:nucleotide-binding universal stress UspA family protein